MPQSLPRPDDSVTRRRAALASGDVHQVLAAAGAWLRGTDEELRAEAEEALAATPASQVRMALAAVDPGVTSEALSRAVDEAFEAAFEEDDEEREARKASGVDALTLRDDVESTLCAVDFVVAHAVINAAGFSEAASLREAASALRASVEAVDAIARTRARSLSPLNVARRARAAQLDDAHRAAAWWWTDRASEADDGLVEALAGLEVTPGERAVAELSRVPLAPRRDALGAALRAAESATDGDPAMRWARAEADRSEAAAIALLLMRDLRVESIDDAALTND